MHYACNYCGHRPARREGLMQEYDECCPGYEDSCRPDLATHTSAAFDPVNDVGGCEKYRFAEGLDEMLMNCEAGLYFKFEEENGIPNGCPGLENFNMETWKSEGDDNIRWMREPTVRRAFEMDCPLQDRRADNTTDSKTVSEVITDYASDQDLWVGDFIAAFGKMTSNGYNDGDLEAAPSSWKNVQCKNYRGKVTCFQN